VLKNLKTKIAIPYCISSYIKVNLQPSKHGGYMRYLMIILVGSLVGCANPGAIGAAMQGAGNAMNNRAYEMRQSVSQHPMPPAYNPYGYPVQPNAQPSAGFCSINPNGMYQCF
jgi:hypothetical protein